MKEEVGCFALFHIRCQSGYISVSGFHVDRGDGRFMRTLISLAMLRAGGFGS